MDRASKHAMIAERIEGWLNVKFMEKTYCGFPGPGVYAGAIAVPDYSSDLNECARAEAKISEMGLTARATYATEIDKLWPKPEYCHNEFYWWKLTAPASARVDAMVDMIRLLDERASKSA